MIWQNKLDKVFEIIDQALTEYTNPYLSMSWGKDSMFLYFLIREVKPDIPVIYLNSGYALPDTYKIRDFVLEKYDINYHEIQQPVDYVELCRMVGLPHDRTRNGQKKAVELLKKNLLDEFAENNGFDLCFWGIRKDESRARDMMFAKYGFFIRTTKIHKCHPIALLTIDQLFYFYEKFKFPMNEIYSKTKFLNKYQIRNTGWLSTDGARKGQIVWLKYYYPDYYIKLVNLFPEIKAYV